MEISVDVEGLTRLAATSKRAAEIVRQEVKKALTASGFMVEAEAKRSIQQGAKTGRTYRKYNPRRMHKASAPGEAPASDTGRLVNSINVRLVENGLVAEVVAGNSAVKYAAMLEFGTPTIAPRPFMHPALERNRGNIKKRFDRALKDGAARIDRK